MEHTTLEQMLNKLTLEDIKQQLALYQKLYYHKRRTEEGFSEGKRESARQYSKRKALDKILNDKNIDIMNNLELTETKTAVKTSAYNKHSLDDVVMLKPLKKEKKEKEEKKEKKEKEEKKEKKEKKDKKEKQEKTEGKEQGDEKSK